MKDDDQLFGYDVYWQRKLKLRGGRNAKEHIHNIVWSWERSCKEVKTQKRQKKTNKIFLKSN